MTVWVWSGCKEPLQRVEHWGLADGDEQLASNDVVILNNYSEPPPSELCSNQWVLNEAAYRIARMTSEEKEARWLVSGVNRGGVKLDNVRKYRIAVMHLVVVAIERIDVRSQAWRTGISNQRDFAVDDLMAKRLGIVAIKALYALGIDFGQVELELGGDGHIAVRDAWPQLSEGSTEAFREFAAGYAAARAMKQQTLLIGADPEFALVTPEGRIVPASRFFGEGAGGAAGADALRIGRRVLYPVAELRPAPAPDPAALAANVRRLLMRAAARISDPSLRWVAGAMPVPGLSLGGHIHLSGAPLTTRLLRLLDSYAAFPLALIEDPAGRARRPRYGSLGDYRLQPHGGFEYRTLPSWLVSPAAAKGAFALALLCAREAWTLTDIPALEERYVEAYYNSDRSTLAGALDRIAAALSASASYTELARYIEPLLDAARRGLSWNEQNDIRNKWRIPIRR